MSNPPDGKPSIPQLAWVFDKLSQHLSEGGTFRELVWRLGYGSDAYEMLMAAGGIEVANALNSAALMDGIEMDDVPEQVELWFDVEKDDEKN